jgi:hypothetical protein
VGNQLQRLPVLLDSPIRITLASLEERRQLVGPLEQADIGRGGVVNHIIIQAAEIGFIHSSVLNDRRFHGR